MEPSQKPKGGAKRRTNDAERCAKRRARRRAEATRRAEDEALADAEGAATFEEDALNDEAANSPLSVGDQESAPPTPKEGMAPIFISDDPPQRGAGLGTTPLPARSGRRPNLPMARHAPRAHRDEWQPTMAPA